MNPGSFFREVLESHEFRSSDKFFRLFPSHAAAYSIMSDKATLSDIINKDKLRRLG